MHCTGSSGDAPVTRASGGDQTTPTATLLQYSCPICRCAVAVSSEQSTAYGDVVGQCVACLDTPAAVFQPQCGHICFCWACARTASDDALN